ncbi:DUF6477 family protein [Halocynthiibacter styelae]|uniref:Uncharacterized protein n=1 Tax=Halocynthiibacter styelae TaxID=2761955 RepID=A0A8J7IC07_9RHOB|nr:DUF6477 family protein [Paenihalocynthiibacter styelae]MBI1492149.1 hypothetical protein [Paenihalocynthiibacter styelae]
MTDLMTLLNTLRRPRLLIRAARFGLSGYSRERDLTRLIADIRLPGPGRAVTQLVNIEGDMDEKRKTGDATYSIARHIEVLVALMAEIQLLRARKQSKS